MDPIIICSLLLVGIGAGIIGTIFGLGGGIIFIPVLTIIYGLSATEASAISLVGIVATSLTAAAIHVKDGSSNIRLGLMMEITSTIGAIAGALIAVHIQSWILLLIFSSVMVYSAMRLIFIKESVDTESDGKYTFTYYDPKYGGHSRYAVTNIPSGLIGCAGAGMISSMTGVGGGAIKVPLMNVHMHIPIKVATATSSYMIGITALSGAMVFFINGTIILEYAAAIAIGAFFGSMIGAKITTMIDAAPLRKYLSVVLLIVAVTTIMKAGGIL